MSGTRSLFTIYSRSLNIIEPMTEKKFPPSQYCSYLLRLWNADSIDQSPWRIVLINLQTGNRQGFSDFEQLANFLREVLPGEVDPISKEA